MTAASQTIRVLHVDDEPDLADLVATFLEREDDRFDVETATSPGEGLDRLAEGGVDCVVSDYDMPGMNGLEFLEAVREEHDDLPFILYTGKGSEEVASDALSKGATDYLQKGSGTEQYELLANRIWNAVETHYSKQRATTLQRVRRLVREINQALIRASSSQEIETEVCNLLTQADPYRFAIFANVDPETKQVIPKTWAGQGDAFLDEFEMSVAEGAPGRDAPGGRAFHNREIAIAQNLQTDPSYEQWRDLALSHGFESLAVVPIEYEETLYGLLAVMADRAYAFDETERAVLTELGSDVAHAISAQTVRRELRQKERRYQAVFNDPNILVGMLDIDGTVLDINETAMGYIDADVGDVTGEPFWETPWFAGDETIQQTVREWIDQAAAGEYVEFELDLSEAVADQLVVSGAFRPVRNDDGEVVSLLVSDRDITERKERTRRLETLIDNLPGVVYQCRNEPEWPMEIVRGESEELSGYSAEELERGDVVWGEDVLHPADQDQMWAAVQEALDSNSPFEVTYRIQTKGGDTKWMWERGQVVSSEHDEETLLEGVITDITEHDRVQRELKQQNEWLEEFASIVSHDLRNPLNVAEGQLELGREECDNEHFESVSRAHDRMNALIDDLLTLAREGDEAADLEPVSLADCSEACWRTVETADATLVADVDRTLSADRSQLRRLLENLYRNAIEHGGTDVTVTVGGLDNGFYVEDDGPGIPEDERDEAFDAGYSTSDAGTGFGLSIVERVVDAHGWGIHVTESSEGGVRFVITGVEFTAE